MASSSRKVVPERPLEPHHRFLLGLGTMGIVFLAHLFFLAAILGLLVLLLVELALVIGGARFGAAGFFLRWMASHTELLVVFFRSAWISGGTRHPLVLSRQEAPALFAATQEICTRAEVPFPDRIVLGMGLNAAVQLEGIWKGRGRTTLLIGIDLLAGLTVTEVESVLGHELMHARRVQRGAALWFRSGLLRIQQLALNLKALIAEARGQNQKAQLATVVHGWADFLARTCTRLVAACSRQDEFDADRGAAEVCGDAAFRQALVKLHALDSVVGRISWAERVARSQSSHGVVDWLVAELANPYLEPDADQGEVTSNRYSTHPSLADRLNALPLIPGKRTPDSRPGVQLLADAEPLAARLMDDYRQWAGVWEQRDDRQLKRSARRFFGGGRLRPLQIPAVALVLFGLLATIVIGVGAKERGMTAVFVGTALAISGLGVLLYRLGAYRPDFTLPIPEYSRLRASGTLSPLAPEMEREHELEVRRLAPDTLRKSKRAAILATSSHTAFAECNFPRAFLLARDCIRLQPKSIPGAVAWLMACAATGNFRFIPQALRFVRLRTGLRGGELAWAVAWTFFKMNDWMRAEMCLARCLRHYPENPTLLALIAIAQSHRGKWQASRENAGKAVRQRPEDRELAGLLVNACIAGGEVRQASELLSSKFDPHSVDPQVLIQWMGIHLLVGDLARAEQVQARLEEAHPTPQARMEAAVKFEAFRQDPRAEELFQRALDTGFLPAAHLGLARVAARRRDWAGSRNHILLAMNLEQPVVEGSVSTAQWMGQSLNQLRGLGRAIPGCRVWWVILQSSLHPSIPPGTRLLVAATSRESAQSLLREAFAAMLPSHSPQLDAAFTWEDAPSSMQPDGPFIPGLLLITDATS